ncbi:MAG: hypothetical protein WBA12_07710, partial [Catalinimonas sp.]
MRPPACRWLVLLLLATSARAQVTHFAYTPAARRTHDLLLTLQLAEAHAAAHRLQAEDAGNGWGPFLRNYTTVAELLTQETEAAYERWEAEEETCLNPLEAAVRRTDQPESRHLLAELHLQSALVRYRFGETWAAAWRVRSAYQLLKENEARFPDYVAQRATLGGLRVALASAPTTYDGLLRLTGLRADLNQGLAGIARSAEAPHPFDLEAALLGSLLRLYVVHDTTALDDLRALRARRADHPLVHYFALNALVRTGHSEEARRADATPPPGTDRLATMHYLRGEMALYDERYAEAERYFGQFLKAFSGHSRVKDAHYKRFLARHLSGRGDADLGAVIRHGT